VEINHDQHPITTEFLAHLNQYLRSGAKQDAGRLERFGVRVISMRHHADKFIIDADADGFPPTYLTQRDRLSYWNRRAGYWSS
jgi:hypothetical protein